MTTDDIAPALRALHKHSSRHRDAIIKADYVRCFYCKAKLKPAQVEDWIDEGNTAMCPECGIDALLPSSALSEPEDELINDMRRAWFKSTKNSQGEHNDAH